jgi:enamine deaminase RidA (YjgF/YER057c/UK114 family)
MHGEVELKKAFYSPQEQWNWPYPVSHQKGVRCGQMVWIGGQMDLGRDGRVTNPGNLAAQAAGCIGNIASVLDGLGCAPTDLVKLLCFYVNDGSLDEDGFLSMVASALPGGALPAVTAVPVPALAIPGVLVAIEGYAMVGAAGEHLPRSYAPAGGLTPLQPTFAGAVRCGKMIFVSGQSPLDADGCVLHPGDIIAQTHDVMARISSALSAFGAGFADVVKINRWYVGQGKTEDFEPAAIACGANFRKPGPAATGIPIPRHAREGQQIRIEVVAMLGEDGSRLPRRHAWPESLWDWTVSIPYQHGVKCHDMIFLGGQVSLDGKGRAVNPNDMRAQTGQAMVHIGSILRDLGVGYSDICKLTTMYAGRGGTGELSENLRIRSAFFDQLGPATTDIPVPVLAYPGMIIEIDAFAMTEPDA